MENETVAKLAELDNIIGIKDATGDVARGRELIAMTEGKMAIYSGDDPTALELILAGGKGDISVTANVAPRQMADLCSAALAGDAERATAINNQLQPLHEKLFVESNPIPVKWALQEMGMITEGIRLPMTQLSDSQQPIVKTAMQQSGIL